MSIGGQWRPVRTADGSWTLAHPGHGELCHSHAGAWLEARERYAGPCRLAERARAGELATLRLLDVGTGLGWNLAAAIQALDGTGARLEAVTLERDPAVIERIRRGPQGPAPGGARPRTRNHPWRRSVSPGGWGLRIDRGWGSGMAGERWHAPVRAALGRALGAPSGTAWGSWGSIRLILGDARESVGGLDPGRGFDAVFLDPFSPGVEPELWEGGFLAEVGRRMAPGSLLATFSAATAVRLALARAGLEVTRGARVGPKAEGTLAGPFPLAVPVDPALGRRIRRRLGAEARARAGRGVEGPEKRLVRPAIGDPDRLESHP